MKFVQFITLLLILLELSQANIFNNKDWDNGKIELLYYDAEISDYGMMVQTEVLSFTRAVYLHKSTGAILDYKRSGLVPIIKHDIQYQYTINDQQKSGLISSRFERSQQFSLLQQEVFWRDWHNYVHRKWKSNKDGYQIESSTIREGNRIFSISKKNVITYEELFSWVRNLDLKNNNPIEINLMEPMTRYTLNPKISLAVVQVHSQPVEIFDQNSIYVQVLKESGETFQFWISPLGLQHIIMAKYPDGTVYKLKESKWIKPALF